MADPPYRGTHFGQSLNKHMTLSIYLHYLPREQQDFTEVVYLTASLGMEEYKRHQKRDWSLKREEVCRRPRVVRPEQAC